MTRLNVKCVLNAEKHIKSRVGEKEYRPASALCLSGGGIRSAAFALGVIQILGQHRLLEKFGYLSTVSGGGYIGGWLTAWRKHAGDEVVFNRLGQKVGPTENEPEEIKALRTNSNYLTPRLGLLSADSWTVIALFIRNLVLNWIVFAPFFVGLLLVPMALSQGFCLLAKVGEFAPLLLAGSFCLTTFALVNAVKGRHRDAPASPTDAKFLIKVTAPVILAAFLFLAALNQDSPAQGVHLLWWSAALFGGAAYALAWLISMPFLIAPKPDVSLLSNVLAWLSDVLAWTFSGVVAGLILVAGIHLTHWIGHQYQALAQRLLLTFGPAWFILSMLCADLAYVGLRSRAKRGDMDREWLARAAGWMSAVGVSWALFCGVALFSKDLFQIEYGWIASLSIGGLSGVIALAFGASGKTAATIATEAGKRLSLTQLASIAGFIFAVMLAHGMALLADLLQSEIVTQLQWLSSPSGLEVLVLAAALIVFSVAASGFVNVNRFSLHALYRNRLVRSFLGAARQNPCANSSKRTPDPFTGFDPKDNPRMADLENGNLMHVVNIALNVTSSTKNAWQERKAEPFTVTPLHVGGAEVGYQSAAEYSRSSGGISLGTAIAISGAAVSPNMGYHSSPLIGFLLMLFNVRLGWWLGNPKSETAFKKDGPNFGLATMLNELAGRTTDNGDWVYLSDGGHFDNLGLYEMVRRKCEFIVVSDAGSDPQYLFEDLGNAVRKIYIDQGIEIKFDDLAIKPRQLSSSITSYCMLGNIKYSETESGRLLYIKPGFCGDEPLDVLNYGLTHPNFPHETTADQWFSESQFESYRHLGAHIMERICNSFGSAQTLSSLDELWTAASNHVAKPR